MLYIDEYTVVSLAVRRTNWLERVTDARASTRETLLSDDEASTCDAMLLLVGQLITQYAGACVPPYRRYH